MIPSVKRDIIGNLVTVGAYPPSEIPEYYYPTRGLAARSCLLCVHCSARRDLRQNKRFIVPLEHWDCHLGHAETTCRSYERLPELRARNMTPLERVYHRMYTRKQLRRLFAQHFRVPRLTPYEFAECFMLSKHEKSDRL